MKISNPVLLVIFLTVCLSNSSYAQALDQNPVDQGKVYKQETNARHRSSMDDNTRKLSAKHNTDASTALIETLIVRPIGFASLIVGTGLFVAITPMAGVASIPAPHDAFVSVLDALVVGPAKCTFVRPLGDFSYDCAE